MKKFEFSIPKNIGAGLGLVGFGFRKPMWMAAELGKGKWERLGSLIYERSSVHEIGLVCGKSGVCHCACWLPSQADDECIHACCGKTTY